jgi:competence protein ComEA
VQRATAVLLTAATLFLAIRSLHHLRDGVRPAGTPAGVDVAYQIDLNSTNRAELLQLPGVGEAMAQRILESRREIGRFHRVDDLRRVRGIGPITMEKLRPWVCVIELDESGSEDEPRARPGQLVAVAERKTAPIERVPTCKKLTKDDALLDLNRATAEELQRLPGIGAKLAQAIVASREKKPFSSVDELRRVKGIGAKTLEKVRPFVIVGSDRLQVAVGE